MFISKKDHSLHEKFVPYSFPVDRRIANHVAKLNKKGYHTFQSYQGSENTYCNLIPYIVFSNSYEFNSKPQGWNIDYVCKNGRLKAILECDMESLDIQGYDWCMNSLMKWIEKLGERK